MKIGGKKGVKIIPGQINIFLYIDEFIHCLWILTLWFLCTGTMCKVFLVILCMHIQQNFQKFDVRIAHAHHWPSTPHDIWYGQHVLESCHF